MGNVCSVMRPSLPLERRGGQSSGREMVPQRLGYLLYSFSYGVLGWWDYSPKGALAISTLIYPFCGGLRYTLGGT